MPKSHDERGSKNSKTTVPAGADDFSFEIDKESLPSVDDPWWLTNVPTSGDFEELRRSPQEEETAPSCEAEILGLDVNAAEKNNDDNPQPVGPSQLAQEDGILPEEPAPLPPISISETLDEHMKVDKGYAALESTITQLADIFVNNQPEWLRCIEVLRKHRQLSSIQRAVRAKAHKKENVAELPKPQTIYVRDVFPDLPADYGDVIVPPGWELRDGHAGTYGLVRLSQTKEGDIVRVNICANPCIVTAWIANKSTRSKCYEVAWRALGRWHTQIVNQAEVKDSSHIIRALGNRGFPVHANNRAEIIQWFADYVRVNVSEIPTRAITEQMGWQEDGSFLAGNNRIIDELSDTGTGIEYFGPDDGDKQLADAVCSSGDYNSWLEAVRPLEKYPLIQIGLYASLATPLLEILGIPNFVVDYSFQTSSGKTSALKIAASAWGSPDERSGKSMVCSWNATRVWFERAAAARSHLPLILDDTKCAMSLAGKSIVPSVIYELTNGEGKGRGSTGGSRGSRRWRTIILSSGEHRAIDESRDGGTAARVLSLWGNPWGGESKEIGDTINTMLAELDNHYGLAGPQLVKYIVDNRSEWPEWRKEYESEKLRWGEKIAAVHGKALASRIAKYIALIQFTANLAHDALWLNTGLEEDCVDKCFDMLVEGPRDTDRAREALDITYAWAVANRSKFYTMGAGREEPHGGWIGRWEADDISSKWEWIGFIPQRLSDFLRLSGFEPKSILRLWASRGWIRISQGHNTIPTRVRDDLVRVVALNRTAVEGLVDEEG